MSRARKDYPARYHVERDYHPGDTVVVCDSTSIPAWQRGRTGKVVLVTLTGGLLVRLDGEVGSRGFRHYEIEHREMSEP